jgi:hypothetical protein
MSICIACLRPDPDPFAVQGPYTVPDPQYWYCQKIMTVLYFYLNLHQQYALCQHLRTGTRTFMYR